MKSHIALKAKSGYLAMKPDASLTITEKNPMFNDVEMFSQTFQLPLDKNRHLAKNLDDVNSTLRAVDMEGERIDVIVDGIPMRTAVLKVQDDVVIDNSIDVNLDATNRTFKDMIQDMQCRDVDLVDDILIGEKIENFGFSGKCVPWAEIQYHAELFYPDIEHGSGVPERMDGGFASIKLKEIEIAEPVFQAPVLGFSCMGKCAGDPIDAPHTTQVIESDGEKYEINKPTFTQSFVNTSQPYPQAKYCNSPVCYSHHKAEKDDNGNITGTSDELVPSENANPTNGYDFSPYWVLPADRPASGLCFYVAYFLECLFKKLGVAYDMTALTDITDFNYLCFFSTAYKYRVGEKVRDLANQGEVNRWLSSRGCGGQVSINADARQEQLFDSITIPYSDMQLDDIVYDIQYNNLWKSYPLSEKVILNDCDDIGVFWPSGAMHPDKFEVLVNHPYNVNILGWGVNQYRAIIDSARINYGFSINQSSAEVRNIYATSENFPNASVSDVISALENSFGVRFCYDEVRNKVTVRLLRDMFRDATVPIKFTGDVLSIRKKSEKVKGIRMKYSAEDDVKEQRDNVKYQKRDYETSYNYIDYRADRLKFAPYADWSKKLDIADMTCYVDLNTGDAFRIKVNSEATTATELKPSAFEVGGNKGAELGDCSVENDEYIKEFVSAFEPIVTNNLKGGGGKIYMVPFVDEDMEHEFIESIIQNPYYMGIYDDMYMYINYKLKMAESYDPTQSDDGSSPLMNHDWGLTIGILRPGRGGQSIINYDYNYDGFGNYRWYQRNANPCITADTMDVYGNFLGTNPAGSFSLKPRAFKPFRYYYDDEEVLHVSTDPKEWDDPKWLIPCNADTRNQQGVITARLASRGMCETWMIDFFRFLLYRQRYEIEALCSAAQLVDIPNRWTRRWEIDGKVGFMNIVEYSVNEDTGLGKVKIDFFAM